MAQSPAVLEGYLSLSGALSRGALDCKLREQIALALAELNGCQYCLSAHAATGRKAGLTDFDVTSSREGISIDARADAALKFARKVALQRGAVSDQDLALVRHAGFHDGDIVEIVAHVALNVLTNYFNKVAATEVDFPKVTPHAAAA